MGGCRNHGLLDCLCMLAALFATAQAQGGFFARPAAGTHFFRYHNQQAFFCHRVFPTFRDYTPSFAKLTNGRIDGRRRLGGKAPPPGRQPGTGITLRMPRTAF
jgi:hypothetical protein